MSRARCRTWTFSTLDRDQAYRLWFDPEVHRWEVRLEGQEAGTLTTRAMEPNGRGALRPKRSEERGAPGRRGVRGENGQAT